VITLDPPLPVLIFLGFFAGWLVMSLIKESKKDE
jgi:hypothetical protein